MQINSKELIKILMGVVEVIAVHISQECAPRSHYRCTSHGVHTIDFYATPPSSLILIDVRSVGPNKGQGTYAAAAADQMKV